MEHLLSTIGPRYRPARLHPMKLFALRSAAAATLLSLLTACGGSDHDAGAPLADSATLARPVMDASTSTEDQVATVQPPPSNEQVPTPDCQPENCQGLRIIDGNAEAYRFDAMSRSPT